ncbi:MAG: dTMP kinase [Candidatus Paceibacterota bacterium]|jgi:dTMP kinase
MAKRGKLIVIDGVDGSGKNTQADLLIKHLRKEGKKVKIMDFPRYQDNFFGKFIGHCLSEQYYNWTRIHPKIASIVYAADRFESKEKIEKWLKEGYIVILDRYISSNQIHQGGKIANVKKREAFMKWLAEMEYKVFKIPVPDLTIYLSLPIDLVMKLIKERNKKVGRAYLKGKKDAHEKDKKFMANSIKSALWLARTQRGWVKVDCAKNGAMKTRKDIHEEVYKKIKKVVK